MAGEIKTGEGRSGLPRFCSERLRARRKKLEIKPDAELHLARVVALRIDYAKAVGICTIKARIEEHGVIEHVGDDILEFETNPLVDLNVFHHSQVHIPIGEATDEAISTSSVVYAQDWVTNCGKEASWVRKGIECSITRIVMKRGAVRMRSREDALLVAAEAGAICRTERLAIGVGKAIYRRSAASSKNRRNRPATKEVPEQAVLSLVVRVINESVDVVHELAVKLLEPVHVVDVEGVILRVCAGSLDESSGAQSFAVGEVLLQGDPVPVVDFERNETGIVVAMADAGIHADTAGELAISAEG
jgi:hypothetical protein